MPNFNDFYICVLELSAISRIVYATFSSDDFIPSQGMAAMSCDGNFFCGARFIGNGEGI